MSRIEPVIHSHKVPYMPHERRELCSARRAPRPAMGFSAANPGTVAGPNRRCSPPSSCCWGKSRKTWWGLSRVHCAHAPNTATKKYTRGTLKYTHNVHLERVFCMSAYLIVWSSICVGAADQRFFSPQKSISNCFASTVPMLNVAY